MLQAAITPGNIAIIVILKTLEKSRTTIYTPVCTGEFRKAPVYGGEKRPKKVFQSFQ